MLCVNNYTLEYIDGCRLRVNVQVSAYQELVNTARNQIGKNETQLNSAIGSFDPLFYNNMVLILDALFVHRARALEKKDGNPLNEVRVVCNSIMNNNNILCADNTIKLNPARSVLKYKTNDKIKLTEGEFLLLSKFFFAEIENKYL